MLYVAPDVVLFHYVLSNLYVYDNNDNNDNDNKPNLTISVAFISWSFPSQKDLETVFHAFITSHLDYCISLCVDLPQSGLSHLQLVQKAAARFLRGMRKKVAHFTSAGKKGSTFYHWLSVDFRIHLKLWIRHVRDMWHAVQIKTADNCWMAAYNKFCLFACFHLFFSWVNNFGHEGLGLLLDVLEKLLDKKQ